MINNLILRNDEAWRNFLHEIGPLIKGICYRAGLGDDDVEDVVQNFAVRLLENNSRSLRSFRFRNRTSFFGWIKVVISRIVLDMVRLRDLRGEREIQSGEKHRQAEHDRSPDSDWVQSRLMLESVSDQLDKDEKVLFWLEYSDYENHEVAEILGISLAAVQQRLVRLRKKLKKMLEGKK